MRRDRRHHPILADVGLAVRAARRAKRLTRKGLAAASGVSERFLAQIEAGRGNPSLLRLHDLSQALDLPLVRLLASRGTSGGPKVALIGLRGAGKSTIGPLLARRLHARFKELDTLIEEAAGLPMGQIFELHGERYFRRLEREVLARVVADRAPLVLATGGGLVTDPETFALLRSAFTTVWLAAGPEDHYARVLAQGDRRPMKDTPNAMAELKALLTAREPLYALADLTVDTSNVGVKAAVGGIAARIRTSGPA